ncbi:MAG: helix-hairpin-helix domain-containing protein [Gammaproteobacteria bacterium]|nr:helix-hairpin-helix domain-containing protein [Gammaproteobacteria bacterium]TVQ46152.1 MAG: helix-hairpin-helix domain-containing protein [Gammaproteobacteria bacterium]
MNQIIRVFVASVALALGGVALAGPVNVNTADAETIAAELSGIGMVRAQAIVEYREAHGPFETIDDLLEISGIGPRVLDMNRADIRLSDEE